VVPNPPRQQSGVESAFRAGFRKEKLQQVEKRKLYEVAGKKGNYQAAMRKVAEEKNAQLKSGRVWVWPGNSKPKSYLGT